MTTPTTLQTPAEQKKMNGTNGSKLSFWLALLKYAIIMSFAAGGVWASSAFITKDAAEATFQKKETALTKEAALEKYVSKEDFKQYREDNKEELRKIYNALEALNKKLDQPRRDNK